MKPSDYTPNMTSKAKKLNELVDKLPVCSSSRGGIRDLVAEITGEKLVELTTYKMGDRFQYIRGPGPNATRDIYLLARTGRDGVGHTLIQAVNTRTGDRRGPGVSVKNHCNITPEELQKIFATTYPQRIIPQTLSNAI
jgi:hypothetical protein